MNEISSNTYYNKISQTYREISKARSNYLEAVDAIVVIIAKESKTKSWLDIGVGDGERLSELLTKIKVDDVVCLEPSAHMFQEALRKLEGRCSVIAECLSIYTQSTERRFSFVTALWNVIGHCEDPVSFLRDAYALLDKKGILLIDANNRYNIRRYGLYRVIKNAILDSCGISTKAIFRLKTGNEGEFTHVYISSPGDVVKACKALDIKNFSIEFFDYSTGKPASFLTGQMVVRISKN